MGWSHTSRSTTSRTHRWGGHELHPTTSCTALQLQLGLSVPASPPPSYPSSLTCINYLSAPPFPPSGLRTAVASPRRRTSPSLWPSACAPSPNFSPASGCGPPSTSPRCAPAHMCLPACICDVHAHPHGPMWCDVMVTYPHLINKEVTAISWAGCSCCLGHSLGWVLVHPDHAQGTGLGELCVCVLVLDHPCLVQHLPPVSV